MTQALARQEGAKRLNVSVRKFDELLATKQILSFKIGKRRLVTEAALENFVRKQERAAK